MKKLFAIAIAVSMLSGLYGLTLGLGVAYEDILEDVQEPYFCVKGDVRVPVLPIVDVRGGLLSVPLPSGGKAIHFGTFVTSDLMIKFPMPSSFHPYFAFGLWFNLGLEDAPGDYMNIGVKAGLGGEMDFGGVGGYLEVGLNRFTYTKDADPSTAMPLYAQIGLTFPVGL